MLDKHYSMCFSFILIRIDSLIARMIIVTLRQEEPRTSELLRSSLSTDFKLRCRLFSGWLGASVCTITQSPYRRIKEAFGLV